MRRAGRYLVRALAAIGFWYALVTVTPIDNWWIRWLAGPWRDPQGEVLVVLGSDSTGDAIGLSSYWRSLYAVRVWREGGFRVVVVSGGAGGGGVSIAEQMRDFMVSQGIPASQIQVETRSHSTRENALESKAILNQLAGRKILLTSDYHMFRAYRTFRRVDIPVEPRPIPDAAKQTGSWNNRWPVFLNLCKETVKIAYYYARGWI